MGDFFETVRPLPNPVIRFDLSHSLQMIHQQGIHCGGSFALNPIPGMGREGVVEGSCSKEGNRRERPGRQKGVHPEQEKAHPDQL